MPQKNHSPRKAIIIALVALLVVAGGLATYVFTFKGNLFGWQPAGTSSSSSSSQSDTTPAQQETPDTTGENTNDSTKNEPETPPVANDFTVTFTRWERTDVRVLINSIVDGTCTLELTHTGSDTITMTAATQAGPSSSTCTGFNYDELPAGTWTATVTVTSGSLKGSASKVIE